MTRQDLAYRHFALHEDWETFDMCGGRGRRMWVYAHYTAMAEISRCAIGSQK